MAKSIISNNPAQLVTKSRANLTDWTSYTPTFEGVTVTNVEAHYRRVGDQIEVKGFLNTSADNGSSFTISLPSGLNLDVSRLSLNSQKLGEVIATRASAQDVMTTNVTAHLYYGNSQSTKVYGTSQTTTNASGLVYGDEGANNWYGGGSSASFYFSAPIAEWSGSDVTFLSAQPTQRIAYLKDVKASGTSGGTSTAGSWNTRDLNTVEGDTEFVSLASNQFTLEAGKYEIEFDTVLAQPNGAKARLYNVTDASTAIVGLTTRTANVDDSHVNPRGVGTITIGNTKVFELQYRVQTGKTTNGLGYSSNFGEDEIYSQVKITKLK